MRPRPGDGGGAVSGLYENGNVWVVAEAITDRNRAYRVLAHEAIGHHGLIEMLGDSFFDLLGEVKRLKKSGDKRVKAAAAEVYRRYRNVPPDEEAAEILAVFAEWRRDRAPDSIWRKMYQAIRRFLRRLGFPGVLFTDADIDGLLNNAERHLETGGPEWAGVDRPARYSRASPVFYSNMERVIHSAFSTQPAKQALQTLRSWAGQGKGPAKFKAEEFEWSGLEEWLQEKGGKVTKAEVLEFLAENNTAVTVEKVSGRDFAKEYALPGGREHKIISVSLPGRGLSALDFESHIDEVPLNTLGWVRISIRTDKDGNKVLFVEEVQSDWHQRGRESGYWDKEEHREYVLLDKKSWGLAAEVTALENQISRLISNAVKNEAQELHDAKKGFEKELEENTNFGDELASYLDNEESELLDQIRSDHPNIFISNLPKSDSLILFFSGKNKEIDLDIEKFIETYFSGKKILSKDLLSLRARKDRLEQKSGVRTRKSRALAKAEASAKKQSHIKKLLDEQELLRTDRDKIREQADELGGLLV